jgi:aminoglycoside phosphotransferase family enzyme
MKEIQIRELIKSFTHDEGHPAKLMETHISWILLTKHFAYKIKKPVKLSFLDFSTLAQRKFFCEREFTLNQALASDMYCKVLPVKKNSTTLFIGSKEGLIIDYAVQMKRLRNNKELLYLIENKKAKDECVLKLALIIAQFHKKAVIKNTPFDPDLFIKKMNDIKEFIPFIENRFSDGVIIRRILRSAGKYIQLQTFLFHKRTEDGMVRDCHGDLHMGNIFLYSRPIIFDCIEFNDSFRIIDVLNDIAFLCMDLDAHGKKALSEQVLKTYLHNFAAIRTKEEEHLFLFFKLYRANVRAKINAMKAIQATNEKDQFAALESLGRYFELMKTYASTLGFI